MKHAVLICGGRDFSDKQLLEEVLSEVFEKLNPSDTLVIVGDADGADALAEKWALANWFSVEKHHADWQTHGKSAGPRRNSEMVRSLCEHDDILCVAFPGGSGTADTVRKCKESNIKVREIRRKRR